MNANEYENQRNELFERWKKARPEYEGEGKRFTIDGIANFDAWKKSNPKILVLLKENHDEEYEPFWGLTVDSKPFSLNIARWRQILIELYNNPTTELSFDSINLPPGIEDIAIVELKKLNERKTPSVYNDIAKYAKQDKVFLIEQVELINPDIILCANTGDTLADHVFNDDKWERLISNSKCHCYKLDNRLIIDFYHPSTRTVGRAKELFDILYRLVKEGNVFEKFDWGKKT